MRRLLIGSLCWLAVGCNYPIAPGRTLIDAPDLLPPAQHYNNPLVMTCKNPEETWERLVWIVSRDFYILREERPTPFRRGYLETEPKASATLLEPWRGDVSGSYNRLESTLQSMRRRVIATMTQVDQGWLVEVQAYRELEDLPVPVGPTVVGSAQFDFGAPVGGVLVEPETGGPPPSPNWIPQGRDHALEQSILSQLVE